MLKKFTKCLCLALPLMAGTAMAQSTITQWNFNSVPPDASTSTGSTTASVGSGNIMTVGGLTPSFASGTSSGGSSDPATTDNTGYGMTGWPNQGTGNKTAGIQFSASTAGITDVVINFDLRHSNTGPKHFALQYTLDVTASTPVWTDAAIDSAMTGDVWVNNRTYNLAAITGLNNNANAGFRIVSAFRPGTTNYVAATSTSSYGTTGTWRFDMVTISGTAAANPTPGSVSFVGSSANVNENGTSVKIVASLANGNTSAASVDVEILPISTATQGADYTATTLTYNFPANASTAKDTLTFLINDDAAAENAEYFIVRFTNPVNVSLPSGNANLYTVFILDNDKLAPVGTQSITLNPVASFSNGTAGNNSAEIVAYDSASQRLFIANSVGGKLDIVDFANPAAPVLLSSLSLAAYGNINSVAARNGIIALAIQDGTNPQANGSIVFLNASGTFINQVTAGAIPDMITFNHAGTKVLTANEGEPNDSYTTDPEGSITIVDISAGIAAVTQANVTTATFTSFNTQAASLKASGVRIFGPGATVAQDLEPEYITISEDDQTAFVTCQENNAIAVVDIATSTVTEVRALGFKDHSIPGNGLDANDQTGVIQIANWPVKGMYQPDAIASYNLNGTTYLVTANEGDARDYSGYSEQARLSSSSYVLDSATFPDAAAIKANIGRLNVTTATGDTDGDGDFDEIHVYGGRSVSIWNGTTGALVWDSGDDMETIISQHPQLAAIFNASNSNNTFKNRSDDKGPEPEGVTTAVIKGRVYAFLALERIGGCMVYDVTDPNNPLYVDYKNTRTIGSYGGDNGAEGILYIAASQSPNAKPYVITANEVSSTLTIFELQGDCITSSASITANGPTSVCPGNSVTLTASTAASYAWSTGDTTQSITVNQSGNYSVVTTTAMGCTDTSNTINVQVKPIPVVKTKHLSAVVFCEGDFVTLTTDSTINYSGFAFQWNKDGNAISGATDSAYNATITGAYTLTVSGGAGCSANSINTQNVTVKPTPTASFATPSITSACKGNTITLASDSVQSGYLYRWYLDGMQLVGIQSSVEARFNGSYSLVTVLNGCKDTSSSLMITINEAPIVTVTTADPTTFCEGGAALLELAPAASGFSYAWRKGVDTIAGANSDSYAATMQGRYRALVTDTNGCTGQSELFMITVEKTPNAVITPFSSTPTSQTLRASYGFMYTYQWFFNNSIIPGATNRKYTATQSGDYTVLVTKGNCQQTSAPYTVSGLRPAAESAAQILDGNFEITAYPNPVSNMLTIAVNGIEAVHAKVQLMDITGKLLAEKAMTETTLSIDMSSYANGMYMLRFADDNGAQGNLRITKQ